MFNKGWGEGCSNLWTLQRTILTGNHYFRLRNQGNQIVPRRWGWAEGTSTSPGHVENFTLPRAEGWKRNCASSQAQLLCSKRQSLDMSQNLHGNVSTRVKCLKRSVQRGCGFLIPGNVQVGWRLEKPGMVEGVPEGLELNDLQDPFQPNPFCASMLNYGIIPLNNHPFLLV